MRSRTQLPGKFCLNAGMNRSVVDGGVLPELPFNKSCVMYELGNLQDIMFTRLIPKVSNSKHSN